jgi:hypothetical protein
MQGSRFNGGLDAKPTNKWVTDKLNHYGCVFNETIVTELLELAQKMDLRTGEIQHGIKCYFENKMVDSAAITELEARFKAWRYIQEHPPY